MKRPEPKARHYNSDQVSPGDIPEPLRSRLGGINADKLGRKITAELRSEAAKAGGDQRTIAETEFVFRNGIKGCCG